jgi:predicted nucleic acid-binding protein
VRRVAVDANVLVSFFLDCDAGQHDAARTLILDAENGDIVAIVPAHANGWCFLES